MRFVRVAAVAALASLVSAPAAFGQEDGVFVDPDSPSAKEYAIPLEDERRQADPGREPSTGVAQGERSSPIFGAGIVRGEKKGSSKPRPGGADAGDGARASKPKYGEADEDVDVVQAATSRPGPPAGGLGVPLTIGGVAIGVLFLGGGAGLLLRRRA